MKIYKSKTLLSIYVQTGNGKGKHLRFDPMSDGRGMLKVTDKKLMMDLEAHSGFGKTFILWRDTEPVGDARTDGNMSGTVAVEAAPAAEVVPVTETPSETVETVTEMTFACFDDAREWVHETYGFAKKKLMSKAAVINAAAEQGVTLIIEE